MEKQKRFWNKNSSWSIVGGILFVVIGLLQIFVDRQYLFGSAFLIFGFANTLRTESFETISWRDRIIIILSLIGMFLAGYSFPK